MKVWLVGERGMLANAMKWQLDSAGVEWTGSDSSVDITSADALATFARGKRFTHVVNCAAFTQVDGAEKEQHAARRVNAEGPRNLWRLCQELGATLLHYSTDYVFAGDSEVPYKETDATSPIGVYGATKLEGEQAVLSASHPTARAYVVRTSWLYGPHGKNFVTTMLRLMAERSELKVVADQLGRPTYTVDLAAVSLKLAGLRGASPPAPPGLYHFANAGQTSWHGFASEILRLAQLTQLPTVTESIAAISSAEFPTPAARPAYSVLDTTRIEGALNERPRPWQSALSDYINRLATSQN